MVVWTSCKSSTTRVVRDGDSLATVEDEIVISDTFDSSAALVDELSVDLVDSVEGSLGPTVVILLTSSLPLMISA